MNKAILISINPIFCEKIANGKKTIEVRKSRPKINTPFKCYIYCTLPLKSELFTHGHIREYANELIRLQSGEIVYDYGMRLICGSSYSKDNFLCQKVIGEFVCDNISNLFSESQFWLSDQIIDESCLSPAEIRSYANGREKIYGWHISNLKIYDKPKELNEFSVVDDLSVKSCEFRKITGQPEYKTSHNGWIKGSYICAKNGSTDWCTKCRTKSISKPPQSWQYIERLN